MYFLKLYQYSRTSQQSCVSVWSSPFSSCTVSPSVSTSPLVLTFPSPSVNAAPSPCVSMYVRSAAVPQVVLHRGFSGQAFQWRCAEEGGFIWDLGVCPIVPGMLWPHSKQVRYQATAKPLAPESCKVMHLWKWCCITSSAHCWEARMQLCGGRKLGKAKIFVVCVSIQNCFLQSFVISS